MAELPTGTVTFLFTDIEGSTKLLHELGDAYADALLEHRQAVRESVAAHAGVEVDTQGDAFLIAFARASDAVAAASATQDALAESPVRVRMGIHTGEPLLTQEGYVGMDVHRGARVMSAGHGGQVLISQTAHDLLDDRFELVDLGEHRLKDLSAPQHLFQLGAEEFPPLATLHQTNLPVQATPLVGRETELEEAAALLDQGRLVTLVGPGGSGKTRLALQLAAEKVEEFPHGVYWVALQTVDDPDHVLPAISQAIGASNGPGTFLTGRSTLLLLDNLEQVLDAAPALTELLQQAADLKLLVTSREPLRIAGEQRFPVEPLPEADAITLFIERAREIDPGYEPSPAVAEICRRLDGLPLALELAAARVSLLSAEELLERLERALPILTGGARDAPVRQRTLRATIEWSYELLDEPEQRLFRALSVFAGSFDVDSAVVVCGADLDTLQSLVDKSLVRRWGSGRLGLLETIREFALEQVGADEAEEAGRRHAAHYLDVASACNFRADATGEEDSERGRLEQANFRAALAWAQAHEENQLGLQIAVALESFFVQTAPFEGIRLFENLFAQADEIPPPLKADALRSFGGAVYIVGEFDRGKKLGEESLAVYRSLGDEWGEGHMLGRLASDALRVGDYDLARDLSNESLTIARRRNDLRGQSMPIRILGNVERALGNHERGIDLLTKAAALARETGFAWWHGGALLDLAYCTMQVDRLEDARKALLEALPLHQRLGDRLHLVYGLLLLGRVLAERGFLEQAGVLWGSLQAEAGRGPIGQWEDEDEQAEFEELRARYEGPDLERGLELGRGLSLNEAVEFALSID
jgi:predicted ATPase